MYSVVKSPHRSGSLSRKGTYAYRVRSRDPRGSRSSLARVGATYAICLNGRAVRRLYNDFSGSLQTYGVGHYAYRYGSGRRSGARFVSTRVTGRLFRKTFRILNLLY